MFHGWVLPILLSALFLGMYDFSKKHASGNNNSLVAMFLATLCGSSLFVIVTFASGNGAVVHCTGREFLLVLLKSCIVSASWSCGYAALRDMPLSIAAPIRATSPLWTFLGGLILFYEVPTPWQACGMIIVFAGYFLFSVWGRLEGFSWHGKSMVLLMSGTLLGTISALYDKYLLGTVGIDRTLMQFYFSVDLVFILGLIAFFSRKFAPFQWRWSIPAIGILLIAADWLYFMAVAEAGSKISILALMRRTSVVISFAAGCWFFKDRKNLKGKIFSLVLIIIGTYLLAQK